MSSNIKDMNANKIQWIQDQLIKSFGKLESHGELKPGEQIAIDLNDDGKIEEWEKFGDLDGNGKIDVKDFAHYYLSDKRRKAAIEKRSHFFRSAAQFNYGGFRADNSLHTHISALSSSDKPEWTEKAYKFLNSALTYAAPKMGSMSNGQKLTWLLEVLGRRGVRYEIGSTSVAEGLGSGGKKTLDCDTYASAVAGMAAQLGIATWAVSAPRHGFIRYKETDGTIHNFDIKKARNPTLRKIGWMKSTSKSDAMYKKRFKIMQRLIKNGTYMRSLTPAGERSNALANSAMALINQGKPQEAIKIAKEALRLNPGSMAAHYTLIYAYKGTGNDEGVLLTCREVLKLDPKCDWAYIHMGDVYKKNNQPALAEKAYKKAVRFNPRDSRANRKLGLMYLDKKNYKAAILHLRRACTYAKEKWDGNYYFLAKAYAKAGDLKKAHWAISEAIKLKPKDAHYYEVRAFIRLEIGWLVLAEQDRKKHHALKGSATT